MERIPKQGFDVLSADEYQGYFAIAQHLFLAGDLKKPTPHPFFRDNRLEIIACSYNAGDNGLFHWHPLVTEYEYILEGKLSYIEASTGAVHQLKAGDLGHVPVGVCVGRVVEEPCRTLAIKVPSLDEKIHCRQCGRVCLCRQEAFVKPT